MHCRVVDGAADSLQDSDAAVTSIPVVLRGGGGPESATELRQLHVYRGHPSSCAATPARRLPPGTGPPQACPTSAPPQPADQAQQPRLVTRHVTGPHRVPGSNPISLRFHRGFTGLVNLPLGASERHREMRDRRARTAISGAGIGEFVGTMVGTVLMVAWRGSTRRCTRQKRRAGVTSCAGVTPNVPVPAPLCCRCV